MKNRKTIILLLILIILLSVIGMIMARYRSKATSAEEIEVAYYVLEADFHQTQTLNLDSLVPYSLEGVNDDGIYDHTKSPYKYNITVSNEKDGRLTETAVEYTVEIKATTNLPLEYYLYFDGEKQEIEVVDVIDGEGDNKIYYKQLITSTKEFGTQKGETHKYTLYVVFPGEYIDNAEYADIIELVEITVDSKQKI